MSFKDFSVAQNALGKVSPVKSPQDGKAGEKPAEGAVKKPVANATGGGV